MSKRDLQFPRPILNAAGTLGFAPDPRAAVHWGDFGAFITNPLSWRRHAGAEHPVLYEYPGGFLLHTGLPNPGFVSALKKYTRRWSEASLPIIVHLMADRPEETREMVISLEGIDNVMAIELGFAPLLADDIILLAVDMSLGELPLVSCLPSEQVLRLGPRILEAGGAAISLAAPRGAVVRNGSAISGRLFGSSLFPQAVDLVYSAARLGLPIIGSGGIFSAREAETMLQAGALAVQLDAQLWLPRE
jgi:dihydroorotate dehydrogenase (NAD+) catalytic subunit